MARSSRLHGSPGRRARRLGTNRRRRGHTRHLVFLVEGGTKGVAPGKPEEKMGQHASSAPSAAYVQNCFVPGDALLGQAGGGFKIAMMALDGGRIRILHKHRGSRPERSMPP